MLNNILKINDSNINNVNGGSDTIQYYDVVRGENLKDVSDKFGIPVSTLCRLNKMEFSELPITRFKMLIVS